jgi:hypothetical protein
MSCPRCDRSDGHRLAAFITNGVDKVTCPVVVPCSCISEREWQSIKNPRRSYTDAVSEQRARFKVIDGDRSE